jgi:hypothetical protein
MKVSLEGTETKAGVWTVCPERNMGRWACSKVPSPQVVFNNAICLSERDDGTMGKQERWPGKDGISASVEARERGGLERSRVQVGV